MWMGNPRRAGGVMFGDVLLKNRHAFPELDAEECRKQLLFALAGPDSKARRMCFAEAVAAAGRHDLAAALNEPGKWVLSSRKPYKPRVAVVYWEVFGKEPAPAWFCGLIAGNEVPMCFSETCQGRAAVWRGRWVCWACDAEEGRQSLKAADAVAFKPAPSRLRVLPTVVDSQEPRSCPSAS